MSIPLLLWKQGKLDADAGCHLHLARHDAHIHDRLFCGSGPWRALHGHIGGHIPALLAVSVFLNVYNVSQLLAAGLCQDRCPGLCQLHCPCQSVGVGPS